MMFKCGYFLKGAALIALCFLALPTQAADGQIALDLRPLTGPNSPLKTGERLVFLGDSITAYGAGEKGYVWLIEQALVTREPERYVEIINAGVPGNTITDLQSRLKADVLDKHPTLVWIYIGINDVWHWDGGGTGTTQLAFRAGLRSVIARIQRTGARVVLATPSVIGEQSPNEHEAMLAAYSQISRSVARERHVVLCDLHRTFVDYLRANNSEHLSQGVLTVDGAHLNDDGNRLVANQAAACLARSLEGPGR